jgi:uncharacterized protein YqhQ
MKSSGIGGQAVIEGVMMKNQDRYAVAVRKPNNEIDVKVEEYKSVTKSHKILGLPIIRGVFSFLDSMVLGMKTLTYSASFFEEEEEKPSKADDLVQKVFKEKAEKVIMGCTIAVSVIIAVALFMILPYFVANIFSKVILSSAVLALVEGLIRLALFVAYIVLISRMKDIQRVFMYHGAEHKCINCIEHGKILNVENVRSSSRQHKRCGTSFLLLVMLISVVFFIFIRVDTVWLRVVVRILLIPVIAGVSYEFIKFAGRSDSRVVSLISKPGLWLQKLTTREPDDAMIEVAIASVEAVFDWKAYLRENGCTAREITEEDLVKAGE